MSANGLMDKRIDIFLKEVEFEEETELITSKLEEDMDVLKTNINLIELMIEEFKRDPRFRERDNKNFLKAK